jgi:hypothetical protein
MILDLPACDKHLDTSKESWQLVLNVSCISKDYGSHICYAILAQDLLNSATCCSCLSRELIHLNCQNQLPHKLR